MSDTDSTALATIPVPGTDRKLVAAQIDGKPHVAIRALCEALGLDHSRQLKKLKSKSWACVALKATHDSSGRTQEIAMIDRRTMTMWLATLEESRINEESRPIVVAFQREAADALDAYFNQGAALNPRLARPSSQLDVIQAMLDHVRSVEEQAAEAKAIAIKSEARLDAMEGRHDWYSALGFARLHGLPTASAHLARLGKQASLVAKANGVDPVKVPHALFGTVNSYPEWIWQLVAA